MASVTNKQLLEIVEDIKKQLPNGNLLLLKQTIEDLQGHFPSPKRTSIRGYPIDSKCLSDVVFMSPKSVSPDKKKAMDPEVPIVNEGSNLDDLWDNTNWDNIEEIHIKGYEI